MGMKELQPKYVNNVRTAEDLFNFYGKELNFLYAEPQHMMVVEVSVENPRDLLAVFFQPQEKERSNQKLIVLAGIKLQLVYLEELDKLVTEETTEEEFRKMYGGNQLILVYTPDQGIPYILVGELNNNGISMFGNPPQYPYPWNDLNGSFYSHLKNNKISVNPRDSVSETTFTPQALGLTDQEILQLRQAWLQFPKLEKLYPEEPDSKSGLTPKKNLQDLIGKLKRVYFTACDVVGIPLGYSR